MNEKQMTAREYLEQIKVQDKKVSKMRVKLKMLRDSMGLKRTAPQGSEKDSCRLRLWG